MRREMVRAGWLIGALWMVGCASEVGNDGAVVGGSCVVSSECAQESVCRTGATFPGGYCATRCTTDEDCLAGSACTADLGGICMVSCGSSGECRSDEGYECLARESRGSPGTVMVCAGG